MALKKTLLIVLGIVIVILYFQCGDRDKEPVIITVKGSTTIAPLIREAAEVYKSHVKIEVSDTGSTDGIAALLTGRCDIAASSREVSHGEVAEAEKRGITLKQFLVAYDMIVPIVHPRNPVEELGLDQLQGIFTGAVSNWSGVGGSDFPIRVAVRDIHSGTFGVWSRVVGPPPGNNPAFVPQSSNSSVLAYVAGHPHAVGYVSFAFLNSEVRALEINGIDVTQKDAVLDKYPLKRNLYLLVNADVFYHSPAVRSFIVFLLMTPTGEAAIQDAGFFPAIKVPQP
jgi:phosphate transport system substrate-binding protein